MPRNLQHASTSLQTDMKHLPYRVNTATGDVFDVEFPLHPDTGSAVRVSGLLSALLETVERDIAVAGATSNGDALQAMAMALAVRARIIHASPEASTRLARSLVDSALGAMSESDRQPPTVGHA